MSRAMPDKPKAEWGGGVEPCRLKAVEGCLAPGARLLDYGCGQGAYVRHFHQHGIDCLGVDLYEFPQWAEIARQLNRPAADLFRVVPDGPMPFPDNAFDAVLCFEVLEHCPDPERVLRELLRVGRRDILLSVPDCELPELLKRHSFAFSHWTDTSHVNFFTRASLQDLLARAGLQVQEISGAYRLDLNACYWDHVRLPTLLRNGLRKFFARAKWVPDYYSAILVHAIKQA